MIYNVYFDIAAVMLGVMLLLIIYLRRTYPSQSITYYKLMLWLNLISSTADIGSAFTISFPERYPLALNYFISVVYLLAHNLTAVVFLIYVIVLIRGNSGTKGERAFWIGAIIFDVLAIVTTPFTKFIFYFDENLAYCHGVLMPVLYLVAFMILLYALILFVYHRKVLNAFQMATNITFLTLVIGAIIFQALFTNVLIESFCGAIAFLMMNVALDNPATFFYSNTYCFNQNAFNSTIEARLQNKDSFTILSFAFDDLPLLQSILGDALFDDMLRAVIGVGHSLYGQNRFFMRSDYCFSVLLEEDKANDEITRISRALGTLPNVSDTMAMPVPHFCVLSLPGLTRTVLEINTAINSVFTEIYPKTGERVIVCDSELLHTTQRDAELSHSLRDAVLNDGFDVYYQPIFEQRTGRFQTAEALIRLRQQTSDEYIGPDEFIPIAEKNGLIVEIGEIVLAKVCRLWHTQKLDNLGIKYIDVNLSMMQLRDKKSVERLEAICIKHGVSPSHINFEITETANANESERAVISEHVAFLRTKGFSFSLDDYGSGYSTATYLAEMPFDLVKIDKNILWKAMEEPTFRIILNNTVHLIREFGKECVVEGVENDEMVKVLTQLGCDYFQGYHYSRPIPEKEFIEFLSNT